MLKAMIKRALNINEEKVLINKTLQCLDKDATNKSRGNLAEDDALDWLKPRTLIRPDDQEEVPEADLEEEVGRILTTINPTWVADEVAYHYGKGKFMVKPKPMYGKAYPLYIHQGTAIRKDSDEAKAQIAAGYGMVSFDDAGPKRVKVKKTKTEEEEEEEPEQEPAPVEEVKDDEQVQEEEKAAEAAEKPAEEKPAEPTEEEPKAEEEAVADEETQEPEEKEAQQEDMGMEEYLDIKPRVKKLANQFNFCERAALTYNYPRRSVETQTIPPPRANFGATALQCIIFDYYQEDYARKMKEKEDEKPKRLKKKKAKHVKSEQQIHDERLAQRIREAWAILERLVNQNIYDDIAQDYRYWDDPSDEFREGMGSLLPLWKFQFDPMRSHAVCDVQWNPHYQDLFAVAYGSLDFTLQQKVGCLCLYSIKNPAYPEYAVITESPVICLDVYKEIPYLICVGLYDGNVCVYNAQLSLESSYQYKSNSVRDKHSNIVWEIRWGPRLIDGEPSFFSISGDGRVVQWAVMPGELQATTIITLTSSVPPIPGPDGTMLTVNSCGSCICFHPEKTEIFMVGTEDGMIHTCSLKYNRNYVRSIQGHHMPVYRIHYNNYNNSIYASCSGDWRVKIWEDGRDEPLFMFELGSPVGDVKWAPYSSTVFAACTADGKVYVYDLNVDKYRPICVQAVVSKKTKKLSRVDFNLKLPVIVCGDTKGTCHVLKLSPNLRVMCKPPKKAQGIDQRTLQIMKLDKLLSLVRDPPFQTGVVDEKFEDD
ncbi:dynein intermediate chain 2, ciliary isoform X1 [Spodoptera frugiperda]|uniref:Dynein intermediate chain 2, ciliary isoform X1 n=2 Tax=Spodoptera frugiperda TaxID=7108 RepID=A0A9R0DPD8_SPOFR|nr:dynein intermediate chain 2, ciliary isoform X1 [Spodoptera frugiperda]